MAQQENPEIDPTKEYDINITHFYKLVETKQYLAKEYSKYLWTFSGGAIGLSVTLVSGAFGSSLKGGLNILLISWVFFAICIFLTMCSNKASQKSFSIEIDTLCNEIAKNGVASTSHYRGKYVTFAKIFDYSASVSFFVGLASLLWFIYRNI